MSVLVDDGVKPALKTRRVNPNVIFSTTQKTKRRADKCIITFPGAQLCVFEIWYPFLGMASEQHSHVISRRQDQPKVKHVATRHARLSLCIHTSPHLF
jgi:hypothetical protein